MQRDKAPYPGLRSFKPVESDIFFGRDECIDVMLSRLAATRFLAVLGSSGIGKSSLVKTGLLSALQMGLLQGAGSSWLIVDFQPGQPEVMPLRNLVHRLLEVTGKPASPDDIAKLHAQFRQDGPRALLKWCDEGNLPKNTNLLLLVDQFEELFRYQGYSGLEEAEAFVALLLESRKPLEAKTPQAAKLPIYVTLTMRSEFLGACSLIQNLPEAITEGAYLTPRMTREQYREAIVGPVEVCGIKIQETLVNRVLNDLAAFGPLDERDTEQSYQQVDDAKSQDQLVRLARRADLLPVLQHALNRMWRNAYDRSERKQAKTDEAAEPAIELTLEDYKAIGGLENALKNHANAVLESVGTTPEIERAAERLFRALVTGATPADAVRQPTLLGELFDIAEDGEAIRKIVEAFRAPECNFLMPEQGNPLDAATTMIDISHESLIRQWDKLRDWLQNEYEAARHYKAIETHAKIHSDLQRHGQSALLTGHLLGYEWDWWQEERPNAAWAKRYGDSFGLAESYLKLSHEAERQRIETTEAARRKSVIRTRTVAAAMGILFLIASGFAGYGYVMRGRAIDAKTIAEEEKKIAEQASDRSAKVFTQLLNEMRGDFRRSLPPKSLKRFLDIVLSGFNDVIKLDADNADAFLTRCIVHYLVEEYESAISDCSAAIKLKPNVPNYYYNRAIALRATGKYDLAMDDLTQVIDLNSDDEISRSAYRSRGVISTLTGDDLKAKGQQPAADEKYTRAAADFHDAIEHFQDPYAMIWQYILAHRGGKDGATATADLNANSDKLKELRWPYEVIKFYLGGPLAALRKAASDTDRKCEFEFYTAEKYLIDGQTNEAKEAFARAIAADGCPKTFLEYPFAQAELTRLNRTTEK